MRPLVLRLTTSLLVVVFACALWLSSYLGASPPERGEVVVFIPKGAGLRRIQAILEEKKVIRADIRFLLLARVSGLSRALRAGEYLLPRGLRPLGVLRLLASGAVLRHQLTIAEGLTIQQIADLFAAEGWVDHDRFLRVAADPQIIASFALAPNSLEGYLFPDTYTLVRGEMDEAELLTMMIARFQQVWRAVSARGETGLSRHEVVTLASIVEKETAAAAERPLIARVFFNRLRLGMKLQSDPTVIYGLEDFQGNLTRADLQRPLPHNTYVIEALPPGPICNPGRAALEAVLHPADSASLYFVSKNDGTHYFSKTLPEHNRAVRTYQLKK